MREVQGCNHNVPRLHFRRNENSLPVYLAGANGQHFKLHAVLNVLLRENNPPAGLGLNDGTQMNLVSCESHKS